LAFVSGLALGTLCVWLLAQVGKSDFAGAPFRRFLRGTRIVSEDAAGQAVRTLPARCRREHALIGDNPVLRDCAARWGERDPVLSNHFPQGIFQPVLGEAAPPTGHVDARFSSLGSCPL
jgi:hypothetical protein